MIACVMISVLTLLPDSPQPTALPKDGSGYVDEDEFVAIYTLAMEGKMFGIDQGSTYYNPPKQLRQWGEHEGHPETDWQDLFFGKRTHDSD